MPTFDELIAVAYKAERVGGRRLAKRDGLSEEAALRITLQGSAGPQALKEFVAARLSAQSQAVAAVAARKQDQLLRLAQKRASRRPDPSAWVAWFDGATGPNPGQMGIGGLLKGPDGQLVRISHAAGHGDSNEAEYLALIAVLEAALPFQPPRLLVYGDSQVVINDANGRCAIATAHLQPYSRRAAQLMMQFASITLAWLPRTRNLEADALSQRALAVRAGAAVCGLVSEDGAIAPNDYRAPTLRPYE